MSALKPVPASAVVLSWVVGVCAGAASIITVLWSASFPIADESGGFNGALFEARGWSVVTLGLVLPLFGWLLHASVAGSVRARLAWLGTLAYLVYTYLELAVSPPFTALYLVYIVAFASALSALVIGIESIDFEQVRRAAERGAAPRRTIAAFALATAFFLSAAWLENVVMRTLNGDFGWPRGEAAISHVVQALDLGLQVPLALATGVLLLRRRAGGYVAASIMLVNAVCMGAALTAMVAASSLAEKESVLRAVPFAAVPLIAAALAAMFFRALGSPISPRKTQHYEPGSPVPPGARAGMA